jgi:hypothetical protein
MQAARQIVCQRQCRIKEGIGEGYSVCITHTTSHGGNWRSDRPSLGAGRWPGRRVVDSGFYRGTERRGGPINIFTRGCGHTLVQFFVTFIFTHHTTAVLLALALPPLNHHLLARHIQQPFIVSCTSIFLSLRTFLIRPPSLYSTSSVQIDVMSEITHPTIKGTHFLSPCKRLLLNTYHHRLHLLLLLVLPLHRMQCRVERASSRLLCLCAALALPRTLSEIAWIAMSNTTADE